MPHTVWTANSVYHTILIVWLHKTRIFVLLMAIKRCIYITYAYELMGLKLKSMLHALHAHIFFYCVFCSSSMIEGRYVKRVGNF